MWLMPSSSARAIMASKLYWHSAVTSAMLKPSAGCQVCCMRMPPKVRMGIWSSVRPNRRVGHLKGAEARDEMQEEWLTSNSGVCARYSSAPSSRIALARAFNKSPFVAVLLPLLPAGVCAACVANTVVSLCSAANSCSGLPSMASRARMMVRDVDAAWCAIAVVDGGVV